MKRLLWHRLVVFALTLPLVAACSQPPPVVPSPAVPVQVPILVPTVGATPIAAPPPSSAVLSMRAGLVEFHTEKSLEWTPAKDGQQVTPGDFVRTGADGLAGLTFADGSVITLLPSSAVQFNFLNLDKADGAIAQRIGRVTLLNGNIAFDVVEAPSPPSAFEIATQNEIVAIKGTKGVLSSRYVDDVIIGQAYGSTDTQPGTAVWDDADITHQAASESGTPNKTFVLPRVLEKSGVRQGVLSLALLAGKVGVAQVEDNGVGAPQLRMFEVDAGTGLALTTFDITVNPVNDAPSIGVLQVLGTPLESARQSKGRLMDAARLVFFGGDKAFQQVETSGINGGLQEALRSLAATPGYQTAFQKMLSAGFFPTAGPDTSRMSPNEASASGALKTLINSPVGDPSPTVSAPLLDSYPLKVGGRAYTDGRAPDAGLAAPGGPSPTAGPAGLTLNFMEIKNDDYPPVRAYKFSDAMVSSFVAVPGAMPPPGFFDPRFFVGDAFQMAFGMFDRFGEAQSGIINYVRANAPVNADVLKRFDLLVRGGPDEVVVRYDQMQGRFVVVWASADHEDAARGTSAAPSNGSPADQSAAGRTFAQDLADGVSQPAGPQPEPQPVAPKTTATPTSTPVAPPPTATPTPLPPTATSTPSPTATSTAPSTVTPTPPPSTPSPTATPIPPAATGTPTPRPPTATPTTPPPTATPTRGSPLG